MNIIEISSFVYRAYPKFQERFKFSQMVSFIDRFEKNLIIIEENNEVKGVALYLMLDDIGLERVKTRVYDLGKPDGFNKALQRKGDNIHFIGVAARDTRTILKGLRQVIKQKKPKTVSWFKPDFIDFRIIKGV